MAVGNLSGAPGSGSPYDQFGAPKPGEAGAAPDPKIAALEGRMGELQAQLTSANEALAKLPDSFKGMNERLGIVDKIIKAVTGGDEPANAKEYRAVMGDLMEVARVSMPGLYKALRILEQDPNAIDKLTSGLDGMAIQRVVGLNETAHSEVKSAARAAGLTAGLTAGEIDEFVFPYETTLTQVINSNEQLRRRFLSGDVKGVVADVFGRIAKPAIARRLREKESRLSSGFPKAPPRGAGAPGAAAGIGGREAVNFKDPKARADFHRQAVGRWLDKGRGSE